MNIKILIAGGLIFFFAFFCFWIVCPERFNYNHDANVSADFLNIARAYQNTPTSISHGIPGRINTGDYVAYSHWPPLFSFGLSRIVDFSDQNWLKQARSFFILMSSITVLLLFIFVWSLYKSLFLAILSSVVYTLIPFNLLYSSLIAGDTLIPLFFILILFFYFYFQRHDRIVLEISTISLISIIGVYISWQVFFLPCAIALYDLLYSRKRFIRSFLILFITSIFVLIWFIWLRNFGTSGSSFEQLYRRSIFSLFSEENGISFLKRLLKLFIEFLPMLVFFIPLVKKKSRLFNGNNNQEGRAAIDILLIALGGYFVVMPGMFSPHEFQYLMIHPLAVLTLVYLIERFSLQKNDGLLIIPYVVVSFLFYSLIMPSLHSFHEKERKFNDQIAGIITEDMDFGQAKLNFLIIDKSLLCDNIYDITIPDIHLSSILASTNSIYKEIDIEKFDGLKMDVFKSECEEIKSQISPFLQKNIVTDHFYFLSKRKMEGLKLLRLVENSERKCYLYRIILK